MFDTYVTVVGNVLTAPQWRHTKQTNTLVAHFKVASTARRFDRETGEWVDGNHLRVRVTCWRRLAEGVSASVMTGDPVIVTGRLFTRDWTDADDNHRVQYELEAVAVGHDLSRGNSKFFRTRPGALATGDTDADGAPAEGEQADDSTGDTALSELENPDGPAEPDDEDELERRAGLATAGR